MKNTIVLTYGKAWSDLMLKDRSAWHTVYPLGTAGFCLPVQAFEKIAQKNGWTSEHTESAWRDLNEPSTAASVIVSKISFYVRNSDVVLVDTDFLDTAVGHEIIRTAYEEKKPCYGVGVSSNVSAIAPYYVSGVWYPGTTADIWKLVDLAFPRYVPPEAEKGALELGKALREREKKIRKSDAVETI